MADDRDGIYSIGAVVKMLGVPAQTLRSWEDRYHQIVPERTSGGHRSTRVSRLTNSGSSWKNWTEECSQRMLIACSRSERATHLSPVRVKTAR